MHKSNTSWTSLPSILALIAIAAAIFALSTVSSSRGALLEARVQALEDRFNPESEVFLDPGASEHPPSDLLVGEVGPTLRLIIIIAILLVGSAFTTITMAVQLYYGIKRGGFSDLARSQFLSAFGAPICVTTALILVVGLRVVIGPIEFKAMGFEFRGASGPIVMWLMCFLALTWAVRYLWRDEDSGSYPISSLGRAKPLTEEPVELLQESIDGEE